MHTRDVSQRFAIRELTFYDRRESSLSGNNKFHVLVTMSCLDNEAEGEVEATVVAAAETKPSDDSLLKNGDAPIATLAPSPSSHPSRPPLDIICVLDTSGSMSSDNKLKNLIYAGLVPDVPL
jgi:Mg-chelatase subunit ChlD